MIFFQISLRTKFEEYFAPKIAPPGVNIIQLLSSLLRLSRNKLVLDPVKLFQSGLI